MVTRSKQRVSAFTFSVLGHAAIVAALTFSLPLGQSQRVASVSAPIEAVMIDGAAINAETERRRQVEIARQADIDRQAERDRQAEIERQAEAERQADVRREAEAEAERQAELTRQAEVERQAEANRQAERDRQAAVERQAEIARQEELERQAEIQRQAEVARQAEIARQAELEREAQLALQAEARRVAQERADRIAEQQAQAIARENADRVARESGAVDQWGRAIKNKVEQYWLQPPTARPGLECWLVVDMLPTGDVRSVKIDSNRCNGDTATQRSIENAVLEASPLPLPQPRSVFQSPIQIVFTPDN